MGSALNVRHRASQRPVPSLGEKTTRVQVGVRYQQSNTRTAVHTLVGECVSSTDRDNGSWPQDPSVLWVKEYVPAARAHRCLEAAGNVQGAIEVEQSSWGNAIGGSNRRHITKSAQTQGKRKTLYDN